MNAKYYNIIYGLVMFMAGNILGTFDPLFGQLKNADIEIKQCQQNLPRDQHCKLVAVPENKGE